MEDIGGSEYAHGYNDSYISIIASNVYRPLAHRLLCERRQLGQVGPVFSQLRPDFPGILISPHILERQRVQQPI